MSLATIPIRFGVKLKLTVLDAFISAVGPMLCDPQVKVYEVTHAGTVRTQLGMTSRKLFTSYPVWNEGMELLLSSVDPDTEILLEVRDGTTGAFLGTASCGMSFHVNTHVVAKRLMLLPRCALGNPAPKVDEHNPDPYLEHLERHHCDDFGHITVSWDVSLIPAGGFVPLADGGSAPTPAPASQSLYCTMMVQWLVAGAVKPGTVHRTIGIVGDQQIPLDAGLAATALLPIRATSILISLQKRAPTDINVEEVQLECPLPTNVPFGTTAIWTLPVTTVERSTNWGALIVHLQLNPAPPPAVARTQVPTTRNPECHPTLLGPVYWEDEHHVARATERRWRRSCVVEAKPSLVHLRHVLDVFYKRAALDPSMHSLFASFYSNHPIEAVDLREMLIGMTFAMPITDIREACLFAFAIMRREADYAITLNDCCAIIEHSLLPLSLDMTATDIVNRVRSLFLFPTANPNPRMTFEEYMKAVGNFGFWVSLGVALDDTTEGAKGAAHAAGSQAGKADPWREITIRVIKTGRAYAVTAHESDSIGRMKEIVQDTINIPPARQRYTFEGKVLDNGDSVGSVFTPDRLKAKLEVTVTEVEETITIIYVHRALNRKWEQKMQVSDKVLKLRGLIQGKTMIPLSRLHLTYAGQVMWDRHSLDHYKMVDGSVVEVTEK